MNNIEDTIDETNGLGKFSNLSALISTLVASVGKRMQNSRPDNLYYNFISGHLTDFAMSATFTFLALPFINDTDSSTKKVLLPLSTPIVLSLWEISSKYTGVGTFDPLDIISYFLGAGFAYATTNLYKKFRTYKLSPSSTFHH